MFSGVPESNGPTKQFTKQVGEEQGVGKGNYLCWIRLWKQNIGYISFLGKLLEEKTDTKNIMNTSHNIVTKESKISQKLKSCIATLNT